MSGEKNKQILALLLQLLTSRTLAVRKTTFIPQNKKKKAT
jgi:hypothetical protein